MNHANTLLDTSCPRIGARVAAVATRRVKSIGAGGHIGVRPARGGTDLTASERIANVRQQHSSRNRYGLTSSFTCRSGRHAL